MLLANCLQPATNSPIYQLPSVKSLVVSCRKLPRYVPYKGTYVPYDGTFGASDQGQMLDV